MVYKKDFHQKNLVKIQEEPGEKKFHQLKKRMMRMKKKMEVGKLGLMRKVPI
jgi:hypothetical protein